VSGINRIAECAERDAPHEDGRVLEILAGKSIFVSAMWMHAAHPLQSRGAASRGSDDGISREAVCAREVMAGTATLRVRSGIVLHMVLRSVLHMLLMEANLAVTVGAPNVVGRD